MGRQVGEKVVVAIGKVVAALEAVDSADAVEADFVVDIEVAEEVATKDMTMAIRGTTEEVAIKREMLCHL